MPAEEHVSIWMRPERPDRAPGPRPAYSRDQITETAIKIADAEGLEAASMRRIAADIGARTAMSLYRYIPKREDLIELMVDAVTGELDLPDRPTGDWRADLALLAHRKRTLGLRHPWLATLLEGHPVWGPNSLRRIEFTLATLYGFGLSMDEILSLTGLVNGYVQSFVRAEVGWAEEARRTGVDMRQWMDDIGPYVAKIFATGRYPMFAQLIQETRTPHMEPDARFQYGLDRVLDSIAASLPDRPKAR